MEKPEYLILVTGGEIGGAQTSVLTLATELRRRGISVALGCGRSGSFLENEAGKRGIPFFRFKNLTRTNNPGKNLLFSFEFLGFLEKNKSIKLVHCNSSNTLFAALGAHFLPQRPKIIFTFRGLSFLDPQHKGLAKFVYFWLFRFLLPWVDESVFVSAKNAKLASRLKIEKKSRVIYNAVLPKDFLLRVEARKFFLEHGAHINEQTFVIGSIGRLAYPKNYEFLIAQMPAILEKNPNSILVLIGDGPERRKYQKLVRDLDLKDAVLFLGSVPNASHYLKGLDVFVLPSIYEGLSISLIEARSAGIPVIASDVGGNKEVVESSVGVYELDNSKDFLALLQKALQKRYHLAPLPHHFTVSVMGDRYQDLYKKLTA